MNALIGRQGFAGGLVVEDSPADAPLELDQPGTARCACSWVARTCSFSGPCLGIARRQGTFAPCHGLTLEALRKLALRCSAVENRQQVWKHE